MPPALPPAVLRPALPSTSTCEHPGQHCSEPVWLQPTRTILRNLCCECLTQACWQLLLRSVIWVPLSLASAFHTDSQTEGISLPHLTAQPFPPLLLPHLPSTPAQGCRSHLTPWFHPNNILTGLTPNSPPGCSSSRWNCNSAL